MLYLLYLIVSLSAYEKSDAFIVKVFDDKVRVLSPTQKRKGQAVIIQNQTLIPLRGKVVLGSKKVLGHLSVPPRKKGSLALPKNYKERIFFVPLSPPFQKVELKIGNSPYEIPEKK